MNIHLDVPNLVAMNLKDLDSSFAIMRSFITNALDQGWDVDEVLSLVGEMPSMDFEQSLQFIGKFVFQTLR